MTDKAVSRNLYQYKITKGTSFNDISQETRILQPSNQVPFISRSYNLEHQHKIHDKNICKTLSEKN